MSQVKELICSRRTHQRSDTFRVPYRDGQTRIIAKPLKLPVRPMGLEPVLPP